MKRTPILVAVLLGLAAFSSANTINLTSGSGKLYPVDSGPPGFTFHFYGGGYGIAIPTALDDQGGDLLNCIPCDPTQIGELFLAEGGFTENNQFVGGIISFTSVSFVSSLAPSGILTVTYTAVPFFYLFLGNQQTSEAIGPFVWGNPNQPWYITAQFTPQSGFPGVYVFAGATFSSSSTPIPEPTAMMLLGTGIWPIFFMVRRRLSPAVRGPKSGRTDLLRAR